MKIVQSSVEKIKKTCRKTGKTSIEAILVLAAALSIYALTNTLNLSVILDGWFREYGRWTVNQALMLVSILLLGFLLFIGIKYRWAKQEMVEHEKSVEHMRYLGFHDSLTGLYNRAYFKEELKRLDTGRQLPLSIIMGDVNGLKVVNDVFGHLEGDKLLVGIACILKDTFREEDIIARWGGDEFVILLPGTGEKDAQEICKRIKIACVETVFEPLQPSIALGTAAKEDSFIDIMQVLKAAEEKMYRNKLAESRSNYVNILVTLRKTLGEDKFRAFENSLQTEQLLMRTTRAI